MCIATLPDLEVQSEHVKHNLDVLPALRLRQALTCNRRACRRHAYWHTPWRSACGRTQNSIFIHEGKTCCAMFEFLEMRRPTTQPPR